MDAHRENGFAYNMVYKIRNRNLFYGMIRGEIRQRPELGEVHIYRLLDI